MNEQEAKKFVDEFISHITNAQHACEAMIYDLQNLRSAIEKLQRELQKEIKKPK
jgi:polyhydroxyalkanoate synthesis regulator phasin